jgi:hypothetical protein
MLWRNGCDGKVLRCGAGNRHQQLFWVWANLMFFALYLYFVQRRFVISPPPRLRARFHIGPSKEGLGLWAWQKKKAFLLQNYSYYKIITAFCCAMALALDIHTHRHSGIKHAVGLF